MDAGHYPSPARPVMMFIDQVVIFEVILIIIRRWVWKIARRLDRRRWTFRWGGWSLYARYSSMYDLHASFSCFLAPDTLEDVLLDSMDFMFALWHSGEV